VSRRYYEYQTIEERAVIEGEIIRKCLARNETQVSRKLPRPAAPL
jgi:AP-4 complex subunit sigma-1